MKNNLEIEFSKKELLLDWFIDLKNKVDNEINEPSKTQLFNMLDYVFENTYLKRKSFRIEILKKFETTFINVETDFINESDLLKYKINSELIVNNIKYHIYKTIYNKDDDIFYVYVE